MHLSEEVKGAERGIPVAMYGPNNKLLILAIEF